MGEKKAKIVAECHKDRISRLPDELIHRILSLLDAKEGVQTSVLSRRWRFVWPTLPFLHFADYKHCSPHNTYMFIRHVLSNRYHRASVYELNMCVWKKECVFDNDIEGCLVDKFVEYATSHNVKCLTLQLFYKHKPFKRSTLSSKSLKELTLQINILRYQASSLKCLPSLTTLSLENWDLYSFDFNLPNLTSLRLIGCRELSGTVWNFPALLTLDLSLSVSIFQDFDNIFSALVNLQNLTIFLRSFPGAQLDDLLLSFPQLLNLTVTTNYYNVPRFNIVVLAPKLHTFTSVGVFLITIGVPQLENYVSIKLQGWFENMRCKEKEKYYQRFAIMLIGLGNAKNFSFDLGSIKVRHVNYKSAYKITNLTELEGYNCSHFSLLLPNTTVLTAPSNLIWRAVVQLVLFAISNFLESFSSPFYNLKLVKLPRGYEESNLSSALRSFLLGSSPRATNIVTTLSQNKVIPRTAAISMTDQNRVTEEPLATATKELVDCQYMNKTLRFDSVDMVVQEHNVVENSLVDAYLITLCSSTRKPLSASAQKARNYVQ